MTANQPPKDTICTAVQVNARAPDFHCGMRTGHNIHVDPKTGTRWSHNGPPSGMRRKYPKKYSNQKLNRQTAIMSRIAHKTKTAVKPKKGK